MEQTNHITECSVPVRKSAPEATEERRQKIAQIRKLVESGSYFLFSAPVKDIASKVEMHIDAVIEAEKQPLQ
jgi:ABC-type sugar transport system ATPase subunit